MCRDLRRLAYLSSIVLVYISHSLPESHSLRHYKKVRLRIRNRDFPGGPVVKTLPSNAGGVGSIPGWGTKIPHAVGCSQKLKKKKKRIRNQIGTSTGKKMGPFTTSNIHTTLDSSYFPPIISLTCIASL